MAQRRIAVVMAAMVALAAILLGRLVWLQVIEHDAHADRAERIRLRRTLVAGSRATITDRNGVVLARDEPAWALRLNYWLLTDPENVQTRLAWRGGIVPGLTPTQVAELSRRLDAIVQYRARRGVSKVRGFMDTWPARQAPLLRAEVAATVRQLAGVLDVDAAGLLAKIRRVEAEITRLHQADDDRITDRYGEIVRLGASSAHWRDLARAERRDGVPEAERRWQDDPLTLAEGLNRDQVETVAEYDRIFFGTTTEATPRRDYPLGRTACHLIGYVRPVDRTFTVEEMADTRNARNYRRVAARMEADVGEELIARYFRDSASFRQAFHQRIAAQPIGVAGLERALNDRLTGRFGISIVESDVRARSTRLIDDAEPAGAGPVALSIDVAVQQAAETALDALLAADGTPGAAVVIDVQTGEILAMASSPGFDLQMMMGSDDAAKAYRAGLVGEEAKEAGLPLYDRSLYARVPPGSVFKIVTAAALAAEGVYAAPDYRTDFDLTGTWQNRERVGIRTGFRNSHGRGRLTLAEMIEMSTNEGFNEAGWRMGYDALRHWSQRFGFGETTGIELVEYDPWRRRADGSRINTMLPVEAPSAAEAPLMSMGQGRLQASPLQVARFMAAVATQGLLPDPTLISGNAGPGRWITGVPEDAWEQIATGMYDVVHGSHGTARRIRALRRFNTAGKTGSAETKRTDELGRDLHWAWFGGYAPAEAPRVAFAVYVEDTTDYGGSVAAPIAAEILAALFD
jgi:peptidoglycan glycosyltransferase